jgi:hypothetical protein
MSVIDVGLVALLIQDVDKKLERQQHYGEGVDRYPKPVERKILTEDERREIAEIEADTIRWRDVGKRIDATVASLNVRLADAGCFLQSHHREGYLLVETGAALEARVSKERQARAARTKKLRMLREKALRLGMKGASPALAKVANELQRLLK